jgi:hypothetical protein
MRRTAAMLAVIAAALIAAPVTLAASGTAVAQSSACSGDYWTTDHAGDVTAHVGSTPQDLITWDFRTTLPAPRAHVVETTHTTGGLIEYLTYLKPSQLRSVQVSTTLGLTWCTLGRR